MAHWRLYYHLVWATWDRLPLIQPAQEEGLYGYIIGKAQELECIVQAIGGVEDHLHLVMSIPPKLAITHVVRRIKGSSAHYVGHVAPNGPEAFRWQGGYGVFSLGGRQLPDAVAYVKNQRAHHQAGTLIASLERTEETHSSDGDHPARPVPSRDFCF